MRMETGSKKLVQLNRSKFRRSFCLNFIDKKNVRGAGMDRIRQDAYFFVNKRLKNPSEDTRITPYRGHPVFTAQHATATCCRKCLWKWHRIPEFKVLDEEDISRVVGIIMSWIRNEMNYSR